MSTAQPFEAQLASSWPPQQWFDVTVLVAVSGGPDSVALLRGLHAIGHAGPGRLVVAHLNHRLRGGEADADEQFVRQLACRLGLVCRVEQWELPRDQQGGLEAAARDTRYDFLRRTAEAYGARFVVTGHTADDQAETVLHHILRGTGLRGLGGIPRARSFGCGSLIRPMLEISREQVLSYLNAIAQPARMDSTNLQMDCTRNRIRHQLLPYLSEQFNPAVVQNLQRLGKLAQQAESVLERLAVDLADQVVSGTGEQVHVNCDRLCRVEPYLLREMFVVLWKRQQWPQQSMTSWHWDHLARLATSFASSKSPQPTMLSQRRALSTPSTLSGQSDPEPTTRAESESVPARALCLPGSIRVIQGEHGLLLRRG